ncbi:MAG: hypothetical protein GY848_15115 [Methyloversatilis sp.]|nr:hypothetical protein [Methyloversatilis sp.]
MALVRCGECGGRVSNLAAACPKCGAPVAAQAGTAVAPAPRSALLAQVRAAAADERAREEVQAEKRYHRRLLVVAVAVGALFLVVRAVTQPSEPVPERIERYGPVSGDFNAALSRALVAANVRGCGQMRWQPVTNRAGDHRVFCSRDGSHWDRYRVTAAGTVSEDFTPVDGAVMDALLAR